MSPQNEAALKLLLNMLKDEDAKTAQEARSTLADLELSSEPVLEVWTKALSHGDAEVRSTAISALQKLGGRAHPARWRFTNT